MPPQTRARMRCVPPETSPSPTTRTTESPAPMKESERDADFVAESPSEADEDDESGEDKVRHEAARRCQEAILEATQKPPKSGSHPDAHAGKAIRWLVVAYHNLSIDPAHWPCIPDEQTCDLQILIPFLRAASSAAVGGAMPPLRATSSAAERLMGSMFTFLPATTSVLSARSCRPNQLKMPSLRAASSAAVGGAMPPLRATSSAAEQLLEGPVYVPTCHRFRLFCPLTARINWRSMSIPNAAPARRVERSSGRRYAFLARHVERSGAVHMYKMPFLRAASSAAVGGAMPPLRATSSAAEQLLGDPSTSLHASASVLSARSPPELIGGPYV
ncbi:hypothetical protein B0H14DRAFT_2642723 [Mycena olivaceomarginata]|nr:hypothetical protein B0H14DRAFT_2642723 [Mycena olivaceomarginata]